MPYLFSVVFCFLLAVCPSWGCTSLLVGKNASATGSTMISYSADSHQLYGVLQFTAAATHEIGEQRRIVDWDSQRPLGEIPQPRETYRVVGNQNEWQVTIAESTWGGEPCLADTTAHIDYGSLIYVALERSKTAREALQWMTQLVAYYGYASEGETFSIGDPDEIWVMDMVGKGTPGADLHPGTGEKGAVWVARRIPDDCVSGHANQARIHTFPQQGKRLVKAPSMLSFAGSDVKQKTFAYYSVGDSCLFSTDVITFARRHGLVANNVKDQNFDFSKAYGEKDYLAFRGCDGRVWAWYNRVASGMERYFPFVDKQGRPTATGYVGDDGQPIEVLPLYVRPDRRLTHRDVQAAMADHFEGTPWDMTHDLGAGPFECPYRWRPMIWRATQAAADTVEYLHERAIATQQTAFTFVAEMRGWLPREIGAKTWFGVDDAATALYLPIYNNITHSPAPLRAGNGDLLTFSESSLFWMTQWVSQQRYTRWNEMSKDVEAVRDSLFARWETQAATLETKAAALLKEGQQDALSALLTDYTDAEAALATQSYHDLAIYLLVKYLDGNVKQEKNGVFARTQYGVPVSPQHPRYNDRYYQALVNERGESLRIKQ